MPGNRQSYRVWTQTEIEALRSGVVKHGAGNWEQIRSDPDFRDALKERTGEQVKDKWRNLVKFKHVTEEEFQAATAPKQARRVRRSQSKKFEEIGCAVDTFSSGEPGSSQATSQLPIPQEVSSDAGKLVRTEPSTVEEVDSGPQVQPLRFANHSRPTYDLNSNPTTSCRVEVSEPADGLTLASTQGARVSTTPREVWAEMTHPSQGPSWNLAAVRALQRNFLHSRSVGDVPATDGKYPLAAEALSRLGQSQDSVRPVPVEFLQDLAQAQQWVAEANFSSGPVADAGDFSPGLSCLPGFARLAVQESDFQEQDLGVDSLQACEDYDAFGVEGNALRGFPGSIAVEGDDDDDDDESGGSGEDRSRSYCGHSVWAHQAVQRYGLDTTCEWPSAGGDRRISQSDSQLLRRHSKSAGDLHAPWVPATAFPPQQQGPCSMSFTQQGDVASEVRALRDFSEFLKSSFSSGIRSRPFELHGGNGSFSSLTGRTGSCSSMDWNGMPDQLLAR
mmetsp:Transcript_16531/g.39232  ORF Transcript_16531/g.39232 Transcript_16531/m.39232 type:complete len:503 (-) Transcript_16531:66-1574(-)